jgi:hypothetical protein
MPGFDIILTHGTVDDFITPHNTELYYQRQVKQFGQSRLDRDGPDRAIVSKS